MSPQRRSRRSAQGLSAQLRRLHAEGRAAFPLELSRQEFEIEAHARLTRRLRRARIPVDGEALLTAAQRTFGADLFLAIACERQTPGAWETLIASHADRLRGVLVRHGAAATLAQEIVADLPGLLLAERGRHDRR